MSWAVTTATISQSGGILSNVVDRQHRHRHRGHARRHERRSYVSQFLSVSFNKVSNNGGLVGRRITFKVSTYNGAGQLSQGNWTMEGKQHRDQLRRPESEGLRQRRDAVRRTDDVQWANSFGNFITSNGVGVNGPGDRRVPASRPVQPARCTGGPNRVQGNVLFNTVYFSNAGSSKTSTNSGPSGALDYRRGPPAAAPVAFQAGGDGRQAIGLGRPDCQRPRGEVLPIFSFQLPLSCIPGCAIVATGFVAAGRKVRR